MITRFFERHAGAFCLTILLLCVAGVAQSAPSAALTASRPVANTDDSVLAATDIAGYEWSCTFTPANGTAAPCANFTGGTVTGSNPSATVTFTVAAAGGNACFQAATKHIVGTVSAKSDPACKAIAAVVPKPPTNVTVTITLALQLSSDSPITVAMSTPVVTSSP